MLEKKKESIQEKEAVLKSGYPAGKSTSTREEASSRATNAPDRPFLRFNDLFAISGVSPA